MSTLHHSPKYEGEILIALAVGPMNTPDLADLLAEDEPATYRHCHHLEDLGDLVSEMGKSSHKLLYCTRCNRVVKNLAACKRKGHDVRSFFPDARVWDLTDTGREKLQELAGA